MKLKQNKIAERSFSGCLRRMSKCRELYVFLIPAVVAVVLFSYVPMYGAQLAFKEMIPGKSITQSDWVGLKHFVRFFSLPDFQTLLLNTFKISFFSNLIIFPMPIIFALMLNEVTNSKFKKLVQTVSYIPHLFSIVVVISITSIFLAPQNGVINIVFQKLGSEPILFFGEDKYVLPIYILTDMWQNLGYGAIVYLAALSAIDQEQLEAAKVDGANRWRVIWNIELPSIASTIVIMQLLRWGNMFAVGADKMLLLQTPLNLGASEIISTYVYKAGLVEGQYGFSTAVNLFNTVINIICLFTVNTLAKKFADTSLF